MASASIPGVRVAPAVTARLWPLVLYPLGVMLGSAYVEADYFRPSYRYVLADAVAASTAIVVVGALVSLAAAVQMTVIVDVWGRLDVRRSTAGVFVRQLLPAVWVGLLTMLTIYGLYVGVGLFQVDRLWPLALVTLTSVLAWACFGALLGLWTQPIIALPVSLVVPLFLMSFPVAWKPLWVRHLTGALFDCCSSDQVLNGRAVAGSILTAGAVAAISIGISALRLGDGGRPTLPVLASAGIGLLLGIGGVLAVRDLGALPTSPRPADEVACREGVCVWEEASSTLDANIDALRVTERAWQALGLPIDEPIEVHPLADGGRLRLAVPSEDQAVIRTSMAERFPIELARCEHGDAVVPGGTTIYDPSVDRLAWLLGIELGLPADRLAYLIDGREVPRSEAQQLWQNVVDCSS